MNVLLGGSKTKVSAIIYRVGREVTVYTPDETATENQYGKVSDGDRSFSEKGTEHARRIYENQNDEASQQLVQGGRLNEDTPRIAFRHDTVAEEGDRVEFPDGTTYDLDRDMPKDTHMEFRSTMIQE